MPEPTEPPPAQPSLADLPEAARRRVLALTADALGGLDEAEVPAPLRRLRQFAPARRAKLGAAAMAAVLAGQPAFRVSVATWLRAHRPELTDALPLPTDPQPPSPDQVAVAVLLAAPQAAHLADRLRTVAAAADAAHADVHAANAAERAQKRAEQATQRAARELAHWQQRAERAEQELDVLRRRVREADTTKRRELEQAQQARDDAQRERDSARQERDLLAEQLRGSQQDLAQLQARRRDHRRADREERRQADLRVRLLLDTVTAAARGLTRELGLPPADGSPADLVAEAFTAQLDPFAGVSDRMLEVADLPLIDRLLALPSMHLMVDGYNVTKTGFATASLEDQRARLVAGLSALAARTGAEVSVVFDAAERPSGEAPTAPRAPRVRVLFSPQGVIADTVLVQLVSAEPHGRPVLVATSDRAVADAVRSRGARVLPSAALLAWLGRS